MRFNTETSISECVNFWVKRLTGLLPLTFPPNFLSTSDFSSEGFGKAKITIPLEIKSFAKIASQPELLITAFSAYLARLVTIYSVDIGYTDTFTQRGITGSGVTLPEYVPLHIALDPKHSFKDLCKNVKKELECIRMCQKYIPDVFNKHPNLRTKFEDFEKIVSVGAVLVNNLEDIGSFGTQSVNLIIPKNGLECILLYDTTAADEESISRFLHHFSVFLSGVLSNPFLRISQQPLINAISRKQLLYEFNDTSTDYPKETVLHELFEEQVEKSPNNIALVYNDTKLTYNRLNDLSNQLARRLRESGVKQDHIVGLMLNDDSIEMIIGMIAILKAGGAYLPIDPEYPINRIEYMIEDSNIVVLLTQTEFNKQIHFEGEFINLDNKSLFTGDCTNLARINQFNDLAYVIYTSGSTGKPKGVLIEHTSIVNQLFGLREKYSFDKSLNHISLPPITFDPSVQQIFLPLISGAKLFLVPKTTKNNLKALLQFIVSNHIDIIDTVPSLMSVLLDHLNSHDNLHFKYIILAGERFPNKLYQRLRETVSAEKIINIYGPTEATINTTLYECLREEKNAIIPIGKPLMNYNVLILDRCYNLCPIGVTGEICISGVGLARGYLNRPQLTAEKFVLNPFIPDRKMYCTGDRGRWTSDGNIEFLGRIDNQVKVRGCRVELEEVEVALGQHSAVRDNIVIFREDENDDKRLVAYCVLDQIDTIPVSELRRFLREKLPEYMIPSDFIFLENFPLTDNRKVDRSALPEPDGKRPNLEKDFVAPRTPIEEEITKIWAKVLSTERVGVHDNFFDLGGTSLIALSLFAQIEKRFGKRLPLAALFPTPTIEKLSDTLRQGNKHYSGCSLIPLQPNGSHPPLFGIHSTRYHTLARHLGPEQPIYALRYGHAAESSAGIISLPDRMEDLAFKYVEEMKTVQPEGPYFLIGLCIGALVAFEMAHQLIERGDNIALLALADPIMQSALKPLPLRTKFSNMLKLGPVVTLTRVQEKVIKKIRLLKSKNSNRAQDKYHNYVPQKVYPGKAIIIKAVGGVALSSTFDPQLGWGKLVPGGLKIHEVHSGHTELFEEPAVGETAEILKAYLAQAQADVSAMSDFSHKYT